MNETPLSPGGFIFELLTLILRTVGAAVVRKHVDQWELARGAADLAEDAKFGPEKTKP